MTLRKEEILQMLQSGHIAPAELRREFADLYALPKRRFKKLVRLALASIEQEKKRTAKGIKIDFSYLG